MAQKSVDAFGDQSTATSTSGHFQSARFIIYLFLGDTAHLQHPWRVWCENQAVLALKQSVGSLTEEDEDDDTIACGRLSCVRRDDAYCDSVYLSHSVCQKAILPTAT